jgi:hypothetical protein
MIKHIIGQGHPESALDGQDLVFAIRVQEAPTDRSHTCGGVEYLARPIDVDLSGILTDNQITACEVRGETEGQGSDMVLTSRGAATASKQGKVSVTTTLIAFYGNRLTLDEA